MPGTYRIELAKTGRAGCKANPVCKANAEKIGKGELRFGVLVEINGHTSWVWRHWGCVTPAVVANLLDACEGDTDLVDGYDELDEASQQKIVSALEQGHIADDDWKGDAEYNRPGMKGFAARPKPAKKAGSDEEQEPTPKKTAGKKRKAVAEHDGSDEAPAKKTKGRPKKVKAESAEQDEPAPKKSKRAIKAEEGSSEDEAIPAKKAKAKQSKKAAKTEAPPKAKRSTKKAVKEESESEDQVASEREELAPKPKRKKAAVKAEPESEADEPEVDDDEEPEPPKKARKSRATKGAVDAALPQKKSRSKKA